MKPLQLLHLFLYLTFSSIPLSELVTETHPSQQKIEYHNDSSSNDSVNTYHVEGDTIRIEGQNPVKVYRTSSKEVVAYFSIFLAMIIGIFILVRFLKARKEQKATAILSLSERELTVARLIQAGKQNKEIAEELFISISTVKTHINNIYKKLDIKDRRALKRYHFPQS